MYASDKSQPTRHTRLFELIRQDNIATEHDSLSPEQRAPKANEMQYFLKHADRSLRSEVDR